VTFEILVAMNMNISTVGDFEPCGLVDSYQCFGAIWSFFLHCCSTWRHRFFRNVGNYLPNNYTVLHCRSHTESL